MHFVQVCCTSCQNCFPRFVGLQSVTSTVPLLKQRVMLVFLSSTTEVILSVGCYMTAGAAAAAAAMTKTNIVASFRLRLWHSRIVLHVCSASQENLAKSDGLHLCQAARFASAFSTARYVREPTL